MLIYIYINIFLYINIFTKPYILVIWSLLFEMLKCAVRTSSVLFISLSLNTKLEIQKICTLKTR